MSSERTQNRTSEPTPRSPEPVPVYEIRVSGRLASRWSAWFDGLALNAEDDGTTVLSGPVVDQAALHGLLQKLRDLGIPLVSLTRIVPDPSAAPPAQATSKEH